jgi:urease accessory protein
MRGGLDLQFSADGAGGAGPTTLRIREQRPPLRVVRAFPQPDGAALVHLHNVSGGVLGGDDLALNVAVGPNAAATLTTPGATRLYRCRAGDAPARQRTDVTVAAGGLLEILPDPLIPFAGSRYRQETRITLGADAGLFWWETVAPGREAGGERFAYEDLHLTMDIVANGRPIAIERTRLQPALRRPDSPARLGPFGYFATLYICRVGLEHARWLALEEHLAAIAAGRTEPGRAVWAVSTLTAHGLVIRALAMNGRETAAGLVEFWQPAKMALYNRAAVPPRKMY